MLGSRSLSLTFGGSSFIWAEIKLFDLSSLYILLGLILINIFSFVGVEELKFKIWRLKLYLGLTYNFLTLVHFTSF